MTNSDTQKIRGLEKLVREEATDLRALLRNPKLPQEKREWIVSRLSYLENAKQVELTKLRAANGTPAAAKKEV